LKIITSADLGGLGPKEGAPVTCKWVVPSIAPALLPWLGILVLLMLKPNRCAPAWWIWAPLILISVLAAPPLRLLPSHMQGIFLDVILALTFGLAAAWLLGNHLGRRGRFQTFLALLPVLAGAGVVTFVGRHGLDIDDSEAMPAGIVFAACVVLMLAGLLLAARFCRRNYGWLKFTAWLAFLLALAWAVLIIPVALIASGGRIPASDLAIAVTTMNSISFGTLLPFLILSFANSFYHDRLKLLLRLGADALPPVNNAASPPVTKPVEAQ
jgi:hypothetical protein